LALTSMFSLPVIGQDQISALWVRVHEGILTLQRKDNLRLVL